MTVAALALLLALFGTGGVIHGAPLAPIVAQSLALGHGHAVGVLLAVEAHLGGVLHGLGAVTGGSGFISGDGLAGGCLLMGMAGVIAALEGGGGLGVVVVPLPGGLLPVMAQLFQRHGLAVGVIRSVQVDGGSVDGFSVLRTGGVGGHAGDVLAGGSQGPGVAVVTRAGEGGGGLAVVAVPGPLRLAPIVAQSLALGHGHAVGVLLAVEAHLGGVLHGLGAVTGGSGFISGDGLAGGCLLMGMAGVIAALEGGGGLGVVVVPLPGGLLPVMAQLFQRHGLAVGVIRSVQVDGGSVDGFSVLRTGGVGGHAGDVLAGGSQGPGVAVVTRAGEGGGGLAVVAVPDPLRLAPVVARLFQRHGVRAGVRLAVQRDSRGVDDAAVRLTIGGGGQAGDVVAGGLHSPDVIAVALTHEGGGGLAVVLVPLPSGRLPAVAQSLTVDVDGVGVVLAVQVDGGGVGDRSGRLTIRVRARHGDGVAFGVQNLGVVVVVLAGESSGSLRVVTVPAPGWCIPIVAQSLTGHGDGVGVVLAVEGDGGGVDGAARFLTGVGVRLRGDDGVHILGMAGVIATLEGGGGLAMVVAPRPGGCLPVVAQLFQRHGLAVGVFRAVQGDFRRVDGFSALFTGGGGGLFGDGLAGGGQGLEMGDIALADERRGSLCVVTVPAPGGCIPIVAQSLAVLTIGIGVLLALQRDGGGVDGAARFLTGVKVRLRGDDGVHGRGVAVVAAAHEGGSGRGVLLVPRPGGCLPVVGQSSDLIGLGVGVGQAVQRDGGGVGDRSVLAAGDRGVRDDDSVHGCGVAVVAAAHEDGGGCGVLVVPAPNGRVPDVALRLAGLGDGVGVKLVIEQETGGVLHLPALGAAAVGHRRGGNRGGPHTNGVARVVLTGEHSGGVVVLVPLPDRLAPLVTGGIRGEGFGVGEGLAVVGDGGGARDLGALGAAAFHGRLRGDGVAGGGDGIPVAGIVFAHEGGSGLGAVLRPGPVRHSPVVAQSRIVHGFGVGEGLAVHLGGGGADHLARVLTVGVHSLTADGGLLGDGVARVLLARQGDAGAAVILSPGPDRGIPVVRRCLQNTGLLMLAARAGAGGLAVLAAAGGLCHSPLAVAVPQRRNQLGGGLMAALALTGSLAGVGAGGRLCDGLVFVVVVMPQAPKLLLVGFRVGLILVLHRGGPCFDAFSGAGGLFCDLGGQVFAADSYPLAEGAVITGDGDHGVGVARPNIPIPVDQPDIVGVAQRREGDRTLVAAVLAADPFVAVLGLRGLLGRILLAG